MTLEVLYLDNHLLVINKPAGLLAQADRTGDGDVVSIAKGFLKKKFNKPGNVFVGLVHRLDRPVSGVMVLARTTKAAARLSAQFRDNLIMKKYIVLVEGRCHGQGVCENYILKKNERVTITDHTNKQSKYARLLWSSVACTGNISILDIDLKTGRPHQIRVQLAHMGLSVLGDLRHGAQGQFDGQNLALHSYCLCLEHPVKKEKMCWTVSPPSTWAGKFEAEISSLVSSLERGQGKQLI